ncbi:uncharacterized protein LOC123556271 [Mercenaria mercenaria]|uniref:uncharacterized protein LOC123556271 n=1 Tax=Mercenaria mercenaria TaxID=6596 RepID=UPI00234E8CDE|nr:uncharacterized protein LOC123556271 [Mercenaria mercenaria]
MKSQTLTDINTRSHQTVSLPGNNNSSERTEKKTPSRDRKKTRTITDINNNETGKVKQRKNTEKQRSTQRRLPTVNKELQGVSAEGGNSKTIRQNIQQNLKQSLHKENVLKQHCERPMDSANHKDFYASSVIPKTRRRVRRKFLGRTVKHKWKDVKGKDKWYEGYVQALLSGEDGELSAKYIVRYSNFNDVYEVEGLVEDYDMGMLKFVDI